MGIPKIYVDTNILKFSATELPRLKPRSQKINWGGVEHEVIVHDFVDTNPNNNINNPELKREADILPELAKLGKNGLVKYVIQMEAKLESWGIPNMDSKSGRFYGAPLEQIDAPVIYSRVIAGGLSHPKDMQYEFLSSLKHKRFIELQKITGAYQGKKKANRNQLLDAFYIWCAEHSGCDYFLTMDFKLIRVVLNNTHSNLSVKLVRPSELLSEFGNGT